jgi:hypothetical protein
MTPDLAQSETLVWNLEMLGADQEQVVQRSRSGAGLACRRH